MSPEEQKLELIVHLIHHAIQSEQDEPALFNDETDLRLNHVYANLRDILGIEEVTL
tara:strand:- start:1053 stop:1220 length:168 start_codon:yes stop_codon:yes gene_type:complete